MSYLNGELVRLRALEPEDIELLYSWENNPDVWMVSNTLVPFSRHILRKYLDNAHLDIYQTKQLRLIIDLNIPEENDSIGAIDLFEFDPYHLRAGIGVLINDRKNRKKGYASEALVLMKDYCFGHLKLHQLYCNISKENQDSLNLFLKCGFQITGERMEWIREENDWKNEYFLQLINM